MNEERITRVDTPHDGTHTHTTIVTDQPHRSTAGTWLVLLVFLLLAVIAFVIFSQMSGAEVAKDHAIADAAGQVGAAAGQVGDAAQDAAQQLGE